MSDFDRLSGYLSICLSQNKINNQQYNNILCSFTENEHLQILEQLNLKNGFISYQREEDNKEIELAYQTSMIDDFIKEAIKNKELLEVELNRINQHIDNIKIDYDNRLNRYRLFPDNPRFQIEYNKIRDEYDILQANSIRLQEEIDDFTQKITNWNNEKNQ